MDFWCITKVKLIPRTKSTHNAISSRLDMLTIWYIPVFFLKTLVIMPLRRCIFHANKKLWALVVSVRLWLQCKYIYVLTKCKDIFKTLFYYEAALRLRLSVYKSVRLSLDSLQVEQFKIWNKFNRWVPKPKQKIPILSPSPSSIFSWPVRTYL